MLNENDLKQIHNLIISFYEKNKYFPFVEDLMKSYSLFFPENLDDNTKNQIDEFVNTIIEEEINKKNTKGGIIMSRILKNNSKLWKKFRKNNSKRFYDENNFQKLGKQIEKLIEEGESRLTEKLVGNKSMGISKASEAWYDMVYAIFPEWNKIK